MSKILVLDDNKGICSLIEEIFTMDGHEVRTYSDISYFDKEIEKFRPDVGLFDLHMAKDMIKIIKKVKNIHPNMRGIIMSADEPQEPFVEFPFISKPFDIITLKNLVYDSLKQEMFV
ncbi:Response regulator receiver domain-containing protein [Thermoanaerobacter uzonensis DSM 18761]|jgi:DNA-binding NtrC family response regulator|uniref:Stage 0 sporulation protein A homolog n=1 Tax=Thermoanaerobacter uzonensis DSM 18761 TaxID=1123369 RepID=A0A1M4S9I7_9THEO|nr:response regulator [Thermoanaerobacter uzonensis]SHE28861.1 Response regulator receiver domain-containing protein [Thermoanaerobacter uzonensis DSM 18761]